MVPKLMVTGGLTGSRRRIHLPPMRARHSAGAPTRLAPSRELLMLDGLSGAGRAAALILALALAAGWGFASLALHQQALAARAGGTRLTPLAAIFADGSSPLTA